MCVSFLFCNFGVEIMYYNISLSIYVCICMRIILEISKRPKDTFSLRMK